MGSWYVCSNREDFTLLLTVLRPEDGKCLIQVFVQAPRISADASLSAVATNAAAVIEHCLLRNPSEGGMARDIGRSNLLVQLLQG